jgi:hypothetical protein
VLAAGNWIGLAGTDEPFVAEMMLGNLTDFRMVADRCTQVCLRLSLRLHLRSRLRCLRLRLRLSLNLSFESLGSQGRYNEELNLRAPKCSSP